jgi:nicotinamide N-methyltransferase
MDDDLATGDLFKDPEGFYPGEEQPNFAEHRMLSGQTVRVRLVGSHPLYVRLLQIRVGFAGNTNL